MEKKFSAFRVFATFYKIAGVLVALGTVLAVILMIVGVAAGDRALRQYGFTGGPLVSIILVIIIFIGGGLSAVGIYALGESMYLLISLEENTRFTAILLRDRFYPQPQSPQPIQQGAPQPAAPLPPVFPPVV